MRRLLMTIALTGVLSGSALAGDVPIVPAPGGGSTATGQTDPGDVPIVPAPREIPISGSSFVLTILDVMF